MYVLKIDFPTGVVYFTGKKKRIQDCESPGLTEDLQLAKVYEDEEEAKKFCKMLIRKYDMEFYYSSLDECEPDEGALDEPAPRAVVVADAVEDIDEINSDVPEEDPFGDDFTVDLGGIMDDNDLKS